MVWANEMSENGYECLLYARCKHSVALYMRTGETGSYCCFISSYTLLSYQPVSCTEFEFRLSIVYSKSTCLPSHDLALGSETDYRFEAVYLGECKTPTEMHYIIKNALLRSRR